VRIVLGQAEYFCEALLRRTLILWVITFCNGAIEFYFSAVLLFVVIEMQEMKLL
jgi:hypothetical protein